MDFQKLTSAFYSLVESVGRIADSLDIMAGNVDGESGFGVPAETTSNAAAGGAVTETKRKRRSKAEIAADKAATEAKGPEASNIVDAVLSAAPPTFNPSVFPGGAAAPTFTPPVAPPAPVAAPAAPAPGPNGVDYAAMAQGFAQASPQDQFRATLELFKTKGDNLMMQQAYMKAANDGGMQMPMSDISDSNLPAAHYINAPVASRWGIYYALHTTAAQIDAAKTGF